MALTQKFVSPTGGGAHDGSTAGDAWTLAEAIATYAAGQQLNVITGTYSNTTTSRTFATAGTTTAPVHWRGYNSSPGDLDAKPTTNRTPGTNMPLVTFSTGVVTVSGAFQTFSGIGFSATGNTASLVSATGGQLKFHRCRFESTNANSGGSAFRAVTNATVHVSGCYFKTNALANAFRADVSNVYLQDCWFDSGLDGVNASSGFASAVGCVFYDQAGVAFNAAGTGTGPFVIDRGTFYSTAAESIKLAAAGANFQVTNCLFHTSGTYDFNNATGGTLTRFHLMNNASYSPGTAHLNGFGDQPEFDLITETVDPMPNAGSRDMTILGNSLSRFGASPGLFEGVSHSSYLDVGASQRRRIARARAYLGLGG